MNRAIIQYLVLLIWLTCPAIGAIRKVPAEYPTIQAAIDASTDGDVILVAIGTYTGDGNRDIDFKGKAITVKSEAGPETCIIDCQGTKDDRHRGFYFHSGEDANSVLQGFTINNGYVSFPWNESGGGIYCYQSSPSIKNCIITGNIALFGGGVACYYSNSVIKNSIIRGNLAIIQPLGWYYETMAGYGGGVYVSRSNTTFVNCLITGNGSSLDGGGVYCSGNPGNSEFVNCTISGNMSGEWGMGGGIAFGPASRDKAVVRNSIVWQNKANLGHEIAFTHLGILGPIRVEIKHSLVGNSSPDSIYDLPNLLEDQWLTVDPLFSQPGYWDTILRSIPGNSWSFLDYIWVDGDYHLKSQAGRWDSNEGPRSSRGWTRDDVTSPCIDSGDPNSPIGHEPFPNGGFINIGAYGGTAEASKSYFGGPVCETILAGDINGDCKVDFKDFQIMALHWLVDNSL